MHASIALCLMLVGGPVAPGPGPEIIFVPLRDDFTALNSMQELEWKIRVRNGYKLPRVPTVVDDTRSRDDGRGMGHRYGQSTDPNAPRRPQQQMPYAPTDPGALGQNGAGQGGGPMPAMPGSGLGQGTSQGYGQNGTGGYDPSATDRQLSKPVTGNYGGYGPQIGLYTDCFRLDERHYERRPALVAFRPIRFRVLRSAVATSRSRATSGRPAIVPG